MNDDLTRLTKVLAKIEKRMHAAEKGNRALFIILSWIENFDHRFETPGQLIKQIEHLCREVLGKN